MARGRFKLSALRVPILQAPMAGGLNTVEQAAAVANAGGVGGFGFAYSDAEKIAADLQAARLQTFGAVNANFFVFQPVQMPDQDLCDAASSALQRVKGMEGVDLKFPQPPFFPDLASQLEAVWDQQPDISAFPTQKSSSRPTIWASPSA